METKGSIEKAISAIPKLKLRHPPLESVQDTTRADGNCAFNALVIGLCELILADKLQENKYFYESVKNILELEEPTSSCFKSWLRQHDKNEWQVRLQKLLRKIAVEEITRIYETHYRAEYQELLWSAYENRDVPQFDDTFKTHKHIGIKFKEMGLTRSQLIEWWEKEDSTGKSPRDIYFNNIKESARHALDRERWGGDPEIRALGIYFKINVEWIKVSMSSLPMKSPIPSLGFGGGIITGLSEAELKLLIDLDLGYKFGNDFLIRSFESKELLQYAMNPKPDPWKTLLSEYIAKCNENTLQIPANLGSFELTDSVRKNLMEWCILSNPNTFLNSNGILERNRILTRIMGAPENLQKKILEVFVIVPKFRLQHTGAHWTYLSDDSMPKVEDKDSKDKNTQGMDLAADLPPSMSLGVDGLLRNVPKNTTIYSIRKLDKQHQTLIDGVFQEYYQNNIFPKETGKKRISPWTFGYVDYIQAICCGKIMSKKYLSEGLSSEGCPACGSPDIQDQLFCMHLKLFPKNMETDNFEHTLPLRAQSTLKLVRTAIEKKRYFLLEHLLLMFLNQQYINHHDIYGRTFIHYAIEQNDCIATLILIKHGANPDALCAFMYSPHIYIDQLVREGRIKGDASQLKTIFLIYGEIPSTESSLKKKNHSLINFTISPEGTRLHFACKNTDEAIVHDLCLDESIDANTRNSSNFTPLATLAYFGHMYGPRISVINFLEAFKRHKSNMSEIFEILLSFRKKLFILNERRNRYYDKNYQFSVFEEVHDFFASRKTSIIYDSDFIRLNRDSENFYYLCSHQINWKDLESPLYQDRDFPLYDDYFIKTFKERCVSDGNTNALNKLLIPCECESSLAMAVVTAQRAKDGFEVSLCLHSLKGDENALFLKRLSIWIKNVFGCTPSISTNTKYAASSNIDTVLNCLNLVLDESGAEKIDCSKAYIYFRVQVPLFLNQKNQSKNIYEEVLKDFDINPDKLVQSSSIITRQDYIVRKLVQGGADIGVHSISYNVFSIAARQYNYGFIKTLINLGISPFIKTNEKVLIKDLSYDFVTLTRILPYYSRYKFGNSTPFLHTCVTLIDGTAKILLSRQSDQKLNLLKIILSDQQKDSLLENWCGKHLINETDSNGETAIFAAIRSGNFAAVEILLKFGASLLVKNNKGEFPIELFAHKRLNSSGACHIITTEMPFELKKLWYLVKKETQNHINAHCKLKEKRDNLVTDFQRLNEKELAIFTITTKNFGNYSSTVTFYPKSSEQDESDEEMEPEGEGDSEEEEYSDSAEGISDYESSSAQLDEDNDKACEQDESDEQIEPEGEGDSEEEEFEDEECSRTILPNMCNVDLLTILDNYIADLNKLDPKPETESQDIPQILMITLLAFQLINHVKLDEAKKKKYYHRLYELYNNISSTLLGRESLFLQTLLTIGSMDLEWREDLLHGLFASLQDCKKEDLKNEKLLMTFLSVYFREDNPSKTMLLKAYIGKLDLKASLEDSSLEDFEKVLINNHGLFTAAAHKMGFCCISDISSLVFKQEEHPKSTLDTSHSHSLDDEDDSDQSLSLNGTLSIKDDDTMIVNPTPPFTPILYSRAKRKTPDSIDIPPSDSVVNEASSPTSQDSVAKKAKN